MSGALLAEIDRWAARSPDADALVDCRGRLTYLALADESRRWAAAMRAAGVGSGDRVAMLAPPGREALLGLLAAEAIGAIWAGLDPRLSTAEIDDRIADLRPALALSFATLGGRDTAAGLLSALSNHATDAPLVLIGEDDDAGTDARPGAMTLAAFLDRARDDALPPADDEGRPAIIVYTSGSSGTPKGAMLGAAAMLDFARRQNALWPVAPMRTLNFLPMSHAGAIVDLAIPTLAAGGCVIFQRKFDALASLQAIATERVTFWGSVPSTFILQRAHPEFAAIDLSSVQLIAIEGAPIPPDLASALLPIAPIATNYGMTESCSAIAAMAPTRSVAELVASVGSPFGDAEVRLDLPDDEGVGEILVRSPRNLIGYWNKPDETRAAFTADGFLRTGDLGALLPDGRLRLRGRKREMFKSGGYNVYPAEIERAIGLHDAVAEVAVVPVADPLWQEVGTAFVVPRDGADAAALPNILRAWCGERLADYKRPKRFVLLDAMPLLPVGKVDRKALQRRAEAA